MDAEFDPEFDALIGAAAPHTVARTPLLEEILRDLVLHATADNGASRRRGGRRRPGGRRWSRRRTGGIVLGLVAAVGIGVGAAAATGILSPSPQTSSWFSEDGVARVSITLPSGKSCEVTVAPVPRETSATALDEWDQTMSAAHAFMKSVDPTAISVADAVTAYRAAAGETRLTREADTELKVKAVAAALNGRMHAALAAQGLAADAVTVATLENCRGAGR